MLLDDFMDKIIENYKYQFEAYCYERKLKPMLIHTENVVDFYSIDDNFLCCLVDYSGVVKGFFRGMRNKHFFED